MEFHGTKVTGKGDLNVENLPVLKGTLTRKKWVKKAYGEDAVCMNC
jgi:hypothetical protein